MKRYKPKTKEAYNNSNIMLKWKMYPFIYQERTATYSGE